MSSEEPPASDLITADSLSKDRTATATQAQQEASGDTAAEQTSTLPSSPPVWTPTQQQMAADKKAMPPPQRPASKTANRKRSHDQSATETESATSAETAHGQIAPAAPEGKQDVINIDSSSQMPPMSTQFSVDGEQLRASSNVPAQDELQATQEQPPAKKTSKSSQGPRGQGSNSAKHTTVAKETRDADGDGDLDSPNESSREDPQIAIEDFDWLSLQQRYHNALEDFHDEESRIMSEFNQLINFFGVWSESGSQKESDRGFKRLKTQLVYVQHEEHELEAKRQHYIRVVNAFKTIALMLKTPEWADGIIQKCVSAARKRTYGEAFSSTRPKSKRLCPSKPVIQRKDWAAPVVDDVDIGRYDSEAFHAARCVIL